MVVIDQLRGLDDEQVQEDTHKKGGVGGDFYFKLNFFNGGKRDCRRHPKSNPLNRT